MSFLAHLHGVVERWTPLVILGMAVLDEVQRKQVSMEISDLLRYDRLPASP